MSIRERHGVDPNRRVQLDGLRLFAMIWIFVHHLAIVSSAPWGGIIGEIGLQVFLAMSGFLTTLILLRDRSASEASSGSRGAALGRFYARRALRLFPAYYLVVAIAWAANLQGVRAVIWPLATYTANLRLALSANPNALGSVIHLWTLSMQEQFYLMWALIVLFVPRRWLVAATLLLIASGPAFRTTAYWLALPGVTARYFPLSWMDTMGLGALLGLTLQPGFGGSGFLSWLERWGIAVGSILSLVAVSLSGDKALGLPAWHLCCGMAICGLMYRAYQGFPGAIGRLLSWPPIVYLGRISYGLYLYHLLMPHLVAFIASKMGFDFWFGGYENFVLSTLAGVCAASLSWFLVEQPMSRLKDRFRTRSATQPAIRLPSAEFTEESAVTSCLTVHSD